MLAKFPRIAAPPFLLLLGEGKGHSGFLNSPYILPEQGASDAGSLLYMCLLDIAGSNLRYCTGW